MTIKESIQNIIGDPGKKAPSIGAAFLLSFTLLFFGPSYMYYGNILEIPYFYSDMVWIFVAYSLAAAAIISGILLILKGTIHQRAVALVFALGLLFWIQGHILIWDYGILDGREIIWNDYLLNGIIDSAVWIAILGVALFKAPSLYKHIALASVLLLVVQGGGLAAEIYQAPDEPEWKGYTIGYDDETMFEFSKEQNVIILVLDAFRSDIFQEIIDEDDEYREMFDGFTYYRNAAGGYPHTDASIPLILTGEYYDNSIPRSEFVRAAFLNNSIPRVLKENGYRVDLYPLSGMEHTVYFSEETASNTGTKHHSRVDKVTDNRMGATELQQLTLFRYVPHFLKRNFHFMPFIGSSGDEKTPHDLAFYNTLVSETSTSNETKIFKFYHNVGPHGPLNLNANLQYEDLPFNHTGYKEQAKASLKISGELVEQLKKHGIYNNSMIFIVGDHGAFSQGHGVRDEIYTGCLNASFSSSNFSLSNWRVVAEGTPLVLMKPFNSEGELAVSDAPVALGDIPRTIVSELQLPDTFHGQSILSVSESDLRERKFFRYLPSEEGQRYYHNKDFLSPLGEYSIIGHSWLITSWRATANIYEPGKGLIDSKTVSRMSVLGFKTQPGVGQTFYDTTIGENVFFSSSQKNSSGYLIYGPYTSLPAGNYTVEYMIKAKNVTSPDDVVTTIDIYSTYIDGSTPDHVVEAKKDVYGRDVDEEDYRSIPLELSVGTLNSYRLIEFRVFQPLQSDLYVKSINISRTD